MGVYDLTRASTRGLIASLCRPTVIGLENVPATGPFIVAANHLSFLDSVLTQALMPRPVAFFAKAEYFTGTGVKGAAMRTFFARAWTEGQPARQVLPELQAELQRIVAAGAG